MPLADLFLSILRGEGTRMQRSRFGHARADTMRKIIVQVIEQYARRDPELAPAAAAGQVPGLQWQPAPIPPVSRPAPRSPSKPVYPPDEQDYRSIVDVLEKHGRSVSMMVLGKVRRRWLDDRHETRRRQPNRLADVLARMVEDGVLRKQGARYVPGPAYGRYLGRPEPVGVG